MLQQTRVETAIPYFHRWMERFPTVEALAEADEESVLKAWEGLGYYSRARNLHRSARLVRERLAGEFPLDSENLKTLPGVGEYSAGAIASIAYGEVVPAVDGNARRVLSRLFDLEDPSDGNLRTRAGQLVDPDRPGDWNQALMELGATVCTPRSPRCSVCPLTGECRALAEGTQELRPAPKRRPAVRTVSYAVLVVVNPAGELLVVRRPSDGLLGGLWEFPAVEIELKDPAPMKNSLPQGRYRVRLEELGISLTRDTVRYSALKEVRHAFTHIKAVYSPMLVTGVGSFGVDVALASYVADKVSRSDEHLERAAAERRWVSPDRVGDLPLPVAQRRILDLARTALEDLRPPASTD
jgi:A/G-specific adenine glycosylase